MIWGVICMNIPKKGYRKNWPEGKGSLSQAQKTTGCEGEIYDPFLAKMQPFLNAMNHLLSSDSMVRLPSVGARVLLSVLHTAKSKR
jgi:hypothetical protein